MGIVITWPNGATHRAYGLQQRDVNKLVTWVSQLVEAGDIGPKIEVSVD